MAFACLEVDRLAYVGSVLVIVVCPEVFLDRYKGTHLALEVKSFIVSLSLRWVPVQGPAIESLDLPLITSIGIAERETWITCKQ
jgi:hypothetical protein